MKTITPNPTLARAHLETATAGPRTVPPAWPKPLRRGEGPVRSRVAGGKTQECSRPPLPSYVLRAGTARAPMGVSRCAPLARTLLALTIVFFLTAPSQAETNKIGIIDMQRVWDKYWKTRQAQAQVDDQTADFEKRKKGMLDDYQKANREYNKLMETAKDQAVSSDEREKRKNEAEKKLREIKEIEQDANLFQRTTDEQLKMQARRMTENILRDIRDLVDAKAKAGGYTLVIDIAAKSAVGTPIVLYNNGQNDMTQEVLSQLNSTAPVGLVKPDESKDQAEEKNAEKKVDKK